MADSTPVEGQIAAEGIHLTFDPATTLRAGDAYQLVLTTAVNDLGGEAIAPVALAFAPLRMAAADAGLYPLSLTIEPLWDDGGPQPESKMSPMPVNSSFLSAPLLGANMLGVKSGGLEALVGDPQYSRHPNSHGHQAWPADRFHMLPIRFAGVLEAGLQTGTIYFTMLTDAYGSLMRNPLRAGEQVPDDIESPVSVDLTMDAVVTSEDARGNVISTQTVMGIHLLGLSTVDGDQLAIEQVGAMDFSTLGINVAPVNLAMRLRTGSMPVVAPLSAPVLLSSYPSPGATGVLPDAPMSSTSLAPWTRRAFVTGWSSRWRRARARPRPSLRSPPSSGGRPSSSGRSGGSMTASR